MNYNLECWVILVLCTNKVKNPIVAGADLAQNLTVAN